MADKDNIPLEPLCGGVSGLGGTLGLTLGGTPRRRKPNALRVDYNPSIWRWHMIPTFLLIPNGKMRGVCRCLKLCQVDTSNEDVRSECKSQLNVQATV